jgi:hypothetical protein
MMVVDDFSGKSLTGVNPWRQHNGGWLMVLDFSGTLETVQLQVGTLLGQVDWVANLRSSQVGLAFDAVKLARFLGS